MDNNKCKVYEKKRDNYFIIMLDNSLKEEEREEVRAREKRKERK